MVGSQASSLVGAEGGIRTHTPLRTGVVETQPRRLPASIHAQAGHREEPRAGVCLPALRPLLRPPAIRQDHARADSRRSTGLDPEALRPSWAVIARRGQSRGEGSGRRLSGAPPDARTPVSFAGLPAPSSQASFVVPRERIMMVARVGGPCPGGGCTGFDSIMPMTMGSRGTFVTGMARCGRCVGPSPLEAPTCLSPVATYTGMSWATTPRATRNAVPWGPGSAVND